MEMFEKMPVFTCNGENLSLDEIQKRVINSVTISYLSEAKKVKAPGLIGMMGKKKVVQEKRSLVINDEQGITIFFALGDPVVSIRFWKKEEWEKLVDYDKKTFFKRYMMTIVHPYQINFHIGNLKSINWMK
jgi:hypothetical protein